MNNHVLIPTNLNDTTDTLTKNAKIVFVYGCLTQCDSWGILPNQPNLMAYKIGLNRTNSPISSIQSQYITCCYGLWTMESFQVLKNE